MAASPNATRHERTGLSSIAQTFSGFKFVTRGLRTLQLDPMVGAGVTTTTGPSHQPKIHNLNALAGSAPVR